MSLTAEPSTERQLTPQQLCQAAYDWGLALFEYRRLLRGLGRLFGSLK
jgi:hypothetical protein